MGVCVVVCVCVLLSVCVCGSAHTRMGQHIALVWLFKNDEELKISMK